MAIVMGMRATIRLNASPEAKLRTQSLFNLVQQASSDLKPVGRVCGTSEDVGWAVLVDGISFIPAHRFPRELSLWHEHGKDGDPSQQVSPQPAPLIGADHPDTWDPRFD